MEPFEEWWPGVLWPTDEVEFSPWFGQGSGRPSWWLGAVRSDYPTGIGIETELPDDSVIDGWVSMNTASFCLVFDELTGQEFGLDWRWLWEAVADCY